MSNIEDREERIEFTGELIKLFVKQDMDTYDIEDVHPDIRAAILLTGGELGEPERYKDDPQA